MIPKNFFNVSNAQASKHDNIVVKIDGYYRSATALAWLQVFDSITTPANGAVPLKQEPINGASPFYFEFKRGDLVCYLGCFVGISSTEGTWTASADTMDVSVEFSDVDLPSTVSYAGDLTTQITDLTVWSEAAGLAARKSLVALEVDGTNLTGQNVLWIMLFATDTINAGQAPLTGCIWPIAGGGIAYLNGGVTVPAVRTGNNKMTFGEFGRQVFSIDGAAGQDGGYAGDTGPVGTKRLGCHVAISLTPYTYTAPTGGYGTCTIKAEYRTEP